MKQKKAEIVQQKGELAYL